MKIKIERSGGFAGIVKSKEMSLDNLPSNIADTVKSIVKSNRILTPSNSIPKGAADHLNYKITIEDGKKNHVIECNQYNIDEKLKSLISYVESKA